MVTDNEFGLRHTEFEGLGGHLSNSKWLAAGNSGLGLRREVRARDTDLGIIMMFKAESRGFLRESDEEKRS